MTRCVDSRTRSRYASKVIVCVGIEVWQAATLAGALGAARVLEALARYYLADGSLSSEEINEAFAKVDKKAVN